MSSSDSRAAMVTVERLGKRYRLAHHQDEPYVALRDVVASAIAKPWRWLRASTRAAPSRSEDFWALRDVSFEVARGEVIGIIGRNGAGKSTLLKILSRITEPTAGRVTLHGRVASLLEVGTGFHPELSGRENIFLNAAILGMKRAEIIRKFDEIVAFADVERFLDTPVKRYSSGMYVRLAFAVAAHLEPDVLVVDEVLAVGDAEFQKKSLGKMHEVSRGGRTVLFVSHNMAAVQALCGRGVWLEKGTVAFQGPASECISRYLSHSWKEADGLAAGAVTVGSSLVLERFEISPNPVESGARVDFVMTLAAQAATRIDHVTLLIYSASEVRLAIVDLRSAGLPATLDAGESWTVRGWIDSLPLVEGQYRVGFGIGTSDFFGDQLGLVALSVTARAQTSDYVPYAAEDRGVVELGFGIKSSGVTTAAARPGHVG
jgi:lipopolysaccharide transport system ATP-binding protein